MTDSGNDELVERVASLAKDLVADAFLADIHNLDTGHREVAKLAREFEKRLTAFLASLPPTAQGGGGWDAAIEAAAKVADNWLAVYGSQRPEFISGQTWANDAVKDIADAIRELALTSPAPAQGWQPIEAQPEFMHRPGRQFIRIEGTCAHSGVNWVRVWCGEAFIRPDNAEDGLLGYRLSDIERLCRDGDIDPHTARVTHWMPAVFPAAPTPAAKEGER